MAQTSTAARHATVPGALDLGGLALIGTFAGPDGARALVRFPGGRIRPVREGDRLKGGRIARIGIGEMEIATKGGVQRLVLPGAG